MSLTYDDGLESHIMEAALELDLRGFKGTFFVPGTSAYAKASPGGWKALAAKGHELGSHGMAHACSESFPWVPTGQALEDYDLPRMAEELDQTKVFLKGLGARKVVSFAYPCGQDFVGEKKESFRPLVAERFIAARGVAGLMADPATVDLMMTPAIDASGKTGEALWSWVEHARKKGGWIIFMNHGVGGDHLPTDADAHRFLLDRLRASEDIWTAPFGEVGKAVAQHQKKAGK